MGSLEPLLLKEGSKGRGAPGVVQRLARRPIADFTDTEHKLWVVDVPNYNKPNQSGESTPSGSAGETDIDTNVRSEPGWRPAYCFSDIEWLPQDFENINFQVSQNPTSMFVQNVLLTKPLLDERGEKCVGQLILAGNEVTRRMADENDEGGQEAKPKETLRKCENEQDRIDAIERWFGVVLEQEEQRGIRGLTTEIKG